MIKLLDSVQGLVKKISLITRRNRGVPDDTQ